MHSSRIINKHCIHIQLFTVTLYSNWFKVITLTKCKFFNIYSMSYCKNAQYLNNKTNLTLMQFQRFCSGGHG
jgi:hypothetical protein